MARWTKESAINRMNDSKLLQEALRIEPRLQIIIKEAKEQRKVRGYNRVHKYVELRNKALHLVGNQAENVQLKTSAFYDAIIHTIDDLLPPDAVDLEN